MSSNRANQRGGRERREAMEHEKEISADTIREFANAKYIEPARRAGATQVTIRAGDIHDEMGLSARMPAVCGAIGANRFQEEYCVKLIKREGPTQGANVYFTFEIPPA